MWWNVANDNMDSQCDVIITIHNKDINRPSININRRSINIFDS